MDPRKHVSKAKHYTTKTTEGKRNVKMKYFNDIMEGSFWSKLIRKLRYVRKMLIGKIHFIANSGY